MPEYQAGALYLSSYLLDTTLGGHNREFWKNFEIAGVEGVNSLDAIDLHSRGNLQIEHVSAKDGPTTEQVEPRLDDASRSWQDMKKHEQDRDRSHSVFRRARPRNPPRIGND